MGLFCLCFGFSFGFFVPDTVFKKFSCCQVWCFWVVVFLPLVVSPTSSLFSLFFLRETAQVVTGHTPTRTLCSFFFFLSLSPAAFVCSPVLAVRPFLLAFCRGAILGPVRFWDSPGTLLRPVLWTRGGKGVLVASCALFCFSRFVLFCGLFSHVLEGADPSSNVAYPQAIAPALRPSEGQGGGIVLGRLDTAFRDNFVAFLCLAEGHRDPLGLFFFSGEGALSLPPQALFHTHLSFVSPPQVFFFFSALGARHVRWLD